MKEMQKMPWLFLWSTNSTKMKDEDHEAIEGKDHKKKHKAL